LKILRETTNHFNDKLQSKDILIKTESKHNILEFNQTFERVIKIDSNDNRNAEDNNNDVHHSFNKEELYKLGLTYWNGQDNKQVNLIKAVEYFQRAADQEHGLANNYIRQIYDSNNKGRFERYM